MKVTIKDIAEQANVSTATVSKVLNKNDLSISKATRERVLKVVKRNNYIPNAMAKGLKSRRSNMIGFILPDITNPFFPELARGIEDKAKEYNFGVVFCNTDDDPDREGESFRCLGSQMIDGIIFASSQEESSYDNALLRSVPVVMVDRGVTIADGNVGKVSIDSRSASAAATQLLVGSGCRRVAYISAKCNTANQRYLGYLGALEKSGIKVDESLIYLGEYDVETGLRGTQWLLEQGSFDGIVCGNDLIAAGAMTVLGRNGLSVPGDVKVIGFDNIYLSQHLNHPLTTVEQPTYEIGRTAAEMLLENIVNGVPLYSRKLDYRIIMRQTV